MQYISQYIIKASSCSTTAYLHTITPCYVEGIVLYNYIGKDSQ